MGLHTSIGHCRSALGPRAERLGGNDGGEAVTTRGDGGEGIISMSGQIPGPDMSGARGSLSHVELILLMAIVALAAGLRAWGLASFSFWEDELYTRIEATHLFASPYATGIEARPLFFSAWASLNSLTSYSAATYRFPSKSDHYPLQTRFHLGYNKQ